MLYADHPRLRIICIIKMLEWGRLRVLDLKKGGNLKMGVIRM